MHCQLTSCSFLSQHDSLYSSATILSMLTQECDSIFCLKLRALDTSLKPGTDEQPPVAEGGV